MALPTSGDPRPALARNQTAHTIPIMKNYGDLSVNLLNGLTPKDFGDRAEPVATNGWTADRSKDAENRRLAVGKHWLTFALSGHDTLPPAYLILTDKAPDVLYVPNVISPARDQLGFDEYNEILRSFVDDVLSRVEPPDS